MKKKVALIDGDGLIYIIAWNFKPGEHDDPILDSVEARTPRVIEQVDQNIISILQTVGATHYIGALGHPSQKCFRHDVAKFKEYKGTRKEEAEIFKLWKPVIKQRLFDHWGFIAVGGLEADDVCTLAAEEIQNQTPSVPVGEEVQTEWIICSPDKDLRQIPGKFYDYKKLDFAEIDANQASWMLWYQMIVGDTSDGVAGIPRKGDKAAHAVLDLLIYEPDFEQRMEQAVRSMYYAHFGDNYGKTIFTENLAVLGMMTQRHLFYEPKYLTESMAGLREVPRW